MARNTFYPTSGGGGAVFNSTSAFALSAPAAGEVTQTIADIAAQVRTAIRFGIKADAVEYAGCSGTAGNATVSFTGSPGFTAALIGKTVRLPDVGAATTLVSRLSAQTDGTHATLERAADYAVSGAAGTFYVHDSGLPGEALARTNSITMAAGSAAITDTAASFVPDDVTARRKYVIPGARADLLVATVTAVPTSSQLTLSVAPGITFAGKTALVGTLNTAALQLLATAGGDWMLPAGGIISGPVVAAKPLTLRGSPGGTTVWSSFATTGVEYLLSSSTDKLRLDSLTIDGAYTPPWFHDNKYSVLLGKSTTTTGHRLTDVTIQNLMGQDGYEQVGYGVYVENANQVVIAGLTISNLSGPALFGAVVDRFTCRGLTFTTIGWYPFNLDRACTNVLAEDVLIDQTADSALTYFGGMFNSMSLQGSAKNKHITLRRWTVMGYANYGAVFRVLSTEDFLADDIRLLGCQAGATSVSDELQLFGVDRRGTTGQPDNGIWKHVTLRKVYVEPAGTGSIVLYCKNASQNAGYAPCEDIKCLDFSVNYGDASNSCKAIFLFHGLDAGIRGIEIDGVDAEYASLAGPVVGAGIGLVGTAADGKVSQVAYGRVRFYDHNQGGSVSTAICINGFVDEVERTGWVRIEGGTYGVRALANSGPTLRYIDEVHTSGTTTPVVWSVLPSTFNQKNSKGVTGSRPSAGVRKDAEAYWDTTLNKPVWWDATAAVWKDATGATV